MKILATNTVSKFNCLQADCPDTCCKGWSMQLDDATFAKYKGTELEQAVDYDGDIRVMKRDKSTDFCIKFTDGKCGIHASKGAEMLGDACNFYPRVTRKFADKTIMTATLSCPEVARLALFSEDANFAEAETDRIPFSIKLYAAEFSGEDALKIHQAFLDACKSPDAPEKIAARIYSAADSLGYQEKNDWVGAAPFMIKMADMKLQKPVADDGNNHKLLQIFLGVIHATGKKRGDRLNEVISMMEVALAVQIDWATLNLLQTGATPKPLEKVQYNDVMRKYVESQISFTSFPFAGLGDNLVDKARLLAFRFALVRLGLMCYGGNDEQKIVQIVQSISRIIDHVADPTLMLNLMTQCGWDKEANLLGLLEA